MFTGQCHQIARESCLARLKLRPKWEGYMRGLDVRWMGEHSRTAQLRQELRLKATDYRQDGQNSSCRWL